MCRVLITVGVILLVAGGYCFIRKDRISTAEEIQIFIAIILTATAITAYFSFLSFQEHNKPFCAVKMVRADVVRMTTLKPEPREDAVFELAAVIKNFGKYIAKNVSYEWEVDIIKNFKDDPNPPAEKIMDMPSISPTFTMLPEQELDNFLIQFNEDDFKKYTNGYESAIRLRMVIKYQDPDGKLQQYLCMYRITRLKSSLQEKPEVTLLGSKFESIPAYNSNQK